MARIRSVLQHPTTKKWAYIEYSDEDKDIQVILGKKEFVTQDEAWEYSKGFEPFSHEWKDPLVIAYHNLSEKKRKLEAELKKVNTKLNDRD